MKEYTLWATPIGAEEWEEAIITSTTDPARLAKAQEWALAHGFEKLRIKEFVKGEMPDFKRAIRGCR